VDNDLATSDFIEEPLRVDGPIPYVPRFAAIRQRRRHPRQAQCGEQPSGITASRSNGSSIWKSDQP